MFKNLLAKKQSFLSTLAISAVLVGTFVAPSLAMEDEKLQNTTLLKKFADSPKNGDIEKDLIPIVIEKIASCYPWYDTKFVSSLRTLCPLWKSAIDLFFQKTGTLGLTLHPAKIKYDLLPTVAPLIGHLTIATEWPEDDSAALSTLLSKYDFLNVSYFSHRADTSWPSKGKGVGVKGLKLLMGNFKKFHKLKVIHFSGCWDEKYHLNQEAGKMIANTLIDLKDLEYLSLEWPMNETCFEEILLGLNHQKFRSLDMRGLGVSDEMYSKLAERFEYLPNLSRLEFLGAGVDLFIPSYTGPVYKPFKEKAIKFSPKLGLQIQDWEEGKVKLENLKAIELADAVRENRTPDLSVKRLKEIELDAATREGREPDYTYITYFNTF